MPGITGHRGVPEPGHRQLEEDQPGDRATPAPGAAGLHAGGQPQRARRRLLRRQATLPTAPGVHPGAASRILRHGQTAVTMAICTGVTPPGACAALRRPGGEPCPPAGDEREAVR